MNPNDMDIKLNEKIIEFYKYFYQISLEDKLILDKELVNISKESKIQMIQSFIKKYNSLKTMQSKFNQDMKFIHNKTDEYQEKLEADDILAQL